MDIARFLALLVYAGLRVLGWQLTTPFLSSEIRSPQIESLAPPVSFRLIESPSRPPEGPSDGLLDPGAGSPLDPLGAGAVLARLPGEPAGERAARPEGPSGYQAPPHLREAYAFERGWDADRAARLYGRDATDPSDGEARYREAWNLLRAGRTEEALGKAARLASGEDAWAAGAEFVRAEALRSAGRTPEAVDAYRRALARGVTPSAYLHLRIASLFQEAGDAVNPLPHYRAVVDDASAPLVWRIEAGRKLASALAAQGRTDETRRLLERLVEASRGRDPVLLADLARLQEGAAAQASWERLARTFPTSEWGLLAANELGAASDPLLRAGIYLWHDNPRLAADLAAPLAVPGDERGVQALLYLAKTQADLGQTGPALESLNRALAWPGTGPWAAELWLQKAHLLAFSHRPAEAAQAYRHFRQTYAGSPEWEDTLYRMTRTRTRAVGGLPDHPLAAQAFWTRREIEEQLFGLGYSALRRGRVQEAVDLWEIARGAQLAGYNQARTLLFLAKAQQGLGSGQDPQALWDQAARVDTETYYGVMARLKQVGDLPSVDGQTDLRPLEAPGQGATARWLTGWSADPALGPEPERILPAADELARLGVWEDRRAFLRESGRLLQDRPLELYALLHGLYQRYEFRLAIPMTGELLAWAPPTPLEALPRSLQHLLFPAPHGQLIVGAARENGLNPSWIFGLIHQESLFDPYAYSHADAMGLTQFIPSTARYIAQRAAPDGFELSDLYLPEVAIRFAGVYLAELEAEVGNMTRAVAAYNAGPGNVRRWLRAAGGDDDHFTQLIHLPETHNYLQAVTEKAYHYGRLYGRPAAPAPQPQAALEEGAAEGGRS